MRICIVGAGAIGGLLAYRLAAAGETVSVVARGSHLDAIRTHGLALYDAMQNRTLPALRMPASDAPEALGPQDVVVVALKAHAIAAMLPRIAPLLGAETFVVPAINGLPWWYFQGLDGPCAGWRLDTLDPHATLETALASERIVGCVVHAAAQVSAPGCIQHTNGWRFVVGEPSRERSARVARFASVLVGAGFEAVVADDIRTEVWWKLLGNLSFNPVATLHRKLLHEVCEDPALRALVSPMIAEGTAVAAKLGVTIAGTPEQRIDVARALRGAKVSMHQDLDARRPLELDAIVKAPIEVADRVGVPVPTLRAIDAEITALARAHGLYPA